MSQINGISDALSTNSKQMGFLTHLIMPRMDAIFDVLGTTS